MEQMTVTLTGACYSWLEITECTWLYELQEKIPAQIIASKLGAESSNVTEMKCISKSIYTAQNNHVRTVKRVDCELVVPSTVSDPLMMSFTNDIATLGKSQLSLLAK